jgi:putative transposase
MKQIWNFIGIPQCCKRVLTGHIVMRARDMIRQIALVNELDLITGKISSDHVHMLYHTGQTKMSVKLI